MIVFFFIKDSKVDDQDDLPIQRHERHGTHTRLGLPVLLPVRHHDPVKLPRRSLLLLAVVRLRTDPASQGHHETAHGTQCHSGHRSTKQR